MPAEILQVPFDEYLKLPAVNASSLKQLAVSPRRYLWSLRNQQTSEAMELGRAVHAAVLEPHVFKAEYVTWGKRKQGKAWEEFRDANADKTILTEAAREKVTGIALAVSQHPGAAQLLSGGVAEQSLRWTDERTGRECKARLDWIGAALVDLKTARDVTPSAFAATSARLLYHMQMAFYADGYEALTGKRLPAKIVAVESEAPHDVAVYSLDEFTLDEGQRMYRQLMDRLIECERNNHWPGAVPDEVPLVLPAWATTEADVGLTFNGEALGL
jgi:hypothetical protein